MAATLKVALIGESGVGKSSILSQFTEGIFHSYIQSTVGCGFDTRTIKLKEINQAIDLELWDTSGRTKFRELDKYFYRNADIIILCYDSTSKYSFEELRYYWYEEEIKNVDHDPILVVVANKNDLYDKNEVKDEEGKAFAEEINAIFQSTSAMSYNSIKSLFENIARKYFDPSFDTNEIENRKKRLINITKQKE